jgi:hypothetical protein
VPAVMTFPSQIKAGDRRGAAPARPTRRCASAFAAAILLVAMGYAVYAAALRWLSPAGASGATAFIFGAVTAILGPRLLRGRAEAAKARAQVATRRVDPLAIRSAIEIGLIVLASIADLASRRRGCRSLPRHQQVQRRSEDHE